MLWMILPVTVEITDTVSPNRLDAHSWVPSGETWSMSGLPPTCHVATTLRVAKLITEMVPAIRLPGAMTTRVLSGPNPASPTGNSAADGPSAAGHARVAGYRAVDQG